MRELAYIDRPFHGPRMEGIIQTVLLFGGVMIGLWLAGHADQWLQRTRGVPADRSGRIPDGPIAKTVLAITIGALAVAYIAAGTEGENAFGDCYGSMRC